VTPRKTITSLASERREFMSLPGSGSYRTLEVMQGNFRKTIKADGNVTPDCGRKRNSLAQERRLAMNTSAAADALDQGDTDRARIRVRTGRLVLCIAREPSWLADGPKRGYGPEQPLAALSSCRHHSLRRGPPP
jgi:hypothetical protein